MTKRARPASRTTVTSDRAPAAPAGRIRTNWISGHASRLSAGHQPATMRRWASSSCAARAAPVRRISPDSRRKRRRARDRPVRTVCVGDQHVELSRGRRRPGSRSCTAPLRAPPPGERPSQRGGRVAAGRAQGEPAEPAGTSGGGGSCDDALEWCRWSASTSCSLFIDERPCDARLLRFRVQLPLRFRGVYAVSVGLTIEDPPGAGLWFCLRGSVPPSSEEVWIPHVLTGCSARMFIE